MNGKFRKWKSITATIVAMLLLAQSLGFGANQAAAAPAGSQAAASVSLSDIGGSYARSEIQALVDRGILSGFQDGTYRPKNAMTRAELSKVLSIAAGLEPNAGAAAVFADIPAAAWYKGYAGALVSAGIATGVASDRFDPNGQVSREQLAAFFVRAMGLQDKAEQLRSTPDVSDLSTVAPWALPSVKLAFSIGFLQGTAGKDGSVRFNPKQHADRQALARLAFEFVEHRGQYEKKAEELTGQPQDPKTGETSGGTSGQTPAPGGGAGGGGSGGGAPGGGSGGGGGGGSGSGSEQPAPSVLSVVSTGTGTAEVTFDRAVGAVAAEDFVFAPALSVSAASVKAGNDKVAVLTTGIQQQGTIYALSYKGASTGKSMTGATTLSSIEPGEYQGDYRVARGVKVFGPASGTAIIRGKLQLDPGADGELLLRNVQADTIEVLSGASKSVHLSGVKVRLQLVINAAGQSASVRIVAEQGTSVAQTSVGSGAILEGNGGSLGDIRVESGAANKQISLAGGIDGKVTVSADDAKLNIDSGATVALIEVLADVELNSAGEVASIVIAAPASVKLAGKFDGTISVTAGDASVNVGESAQVASIELKASAILLVNGRLDSLQSSDANLFIQLSGSRANALAQQAASSAAAAIAKLPGVSGLKLGDRFSVREARAKTTGAWLLEPAAEIVGLDKLVAAEGTIKQLAAAAFNEAVQALPQDVWLDDRDNLRGKLKTAEEALRLAREEEQVPDALLTGLARLSGAQFDLRFLDQLAQMIADANAALAKLPDAATIDADGIAQTRWLVNEAERTMRRAQDNGATSKNFVGIDRYVATRDRLVELEKKLDSNAQFAVSVQVELMKLASFERISLSDRTYIEWLRGSVDTAILFGAIPPTLEALSVLNAAEARLKELEVQKNTAVQAAIQAIAALPAAAELKLQQAGAVSDAQTKATAAIQLGATASDMSGMDKLTALTARLTELQNIKADLVKAALAAIAALPLPDKLKPADIPALQLARSKVQAALEGGAAETDISNLAKLKAGESRLSALQQAQAASDAIAALPEAGQLTLGDSGKVAEARAKASAALALPGITAEHIPSLAKLVAAEARIAELTAFKAEKTQLASAAIGKLPAASAVSASDGQLILTARQAVNEALSAGAVRQEIGGMDKLEAVEAAFAGLAETAEPLIAAPAYSGALLLTGTAEAGATIKADAGGKTATALAQADGQFFLYDGSIILAAGDRITVTAQAPGKKPSSAIAMTAKGVQGRTAAPTARTSYEGDWFLGVTTRSDATLYLLDRSGKMVAHYEAASAAEIDSAYVYLYPADGTPLPAGELRLYARSPGQAPSVPVSVEVGAVAEKLTAQPIVDSEVYDSDDWMEIRTEPYAIVRVSGGDGDRKAFAEAGAEGLVYVDLQVFTEDNRLTLQSKAPGKRAGEPLTVPLLHAVAKAAAPVVTGQSGAGYLLIEGRLDPASSLEFDESVSYAVARASDDHFYAAVARRMNPGDTITIRARQHGKLPSDPVTVRVAEELPKAAKPQAVEDPVAGGFYINLKNENMYRLTVIERSDGSIATWNLDSDWSSGSSRWYMEPSDMLEGSRLNVTSTVIGASTSEALALTARSPDEVLPGPKIEGAYYGDGVLWVRAMTVPRATLRITVGNSGFQWEADENGLVDNYAYMDGNPDAIVHMQVQTAGRALSKIAEAQLQVPATAAATPVITSPVYADSTYVRGRASAGDLLVATTSDGLMIGEGRAASDGSCQIYLFDFYRHLWPAGSTIEIRAIGFGRQASDAVSVLVEPLVGQTGSPVALNELYEGSFELRASAEPNATVRLKDQSGRLLAASSGGDDGRVYFSLENVQFHAGDTLYLTADISGKAESDPTSIVVLANNGVTELTVTSGGFYTNGFVIKGTTAPHARLKLVIDSSSYGTYADDAGKFRMDSVGYWRDIPAGQSAYLIAIADGWARSEPVAFTAMPPAGTTDQPVLDAVSAVYEDGWIIRGEAAPNTIVKLAKQDGTTLYWQSGTSADFMFYDDEGGLKAGSKVQLTALTPGKLESEPVVMEVQPLNGKTDVGVLPKLDEGSLSWIGQAQPYSRVTITNAAGQTVASAHTYSSTNYFMNLFGDGKPLSASQTYSLTADTIGKAPSDTVPLSIGQASGTTAIASVSSSILNREFQLTGLTDPWATVMLLYPEGSGSTWTTANEEGRYYLEGYWSGAADAVFKLVAAAPGKYRSDISAVILTPGSSTMKPVLMKDSVITEEGFDLIGSVEPGSSLQLQSADGRVLAESGTWSNDVFRWTSSQSLPVGPARLIATVRGKSPSESVTLEIAPLSGKTKPIALRDLSFTPATLNLRGTGEPDSQAFLVNDQGEQIAFGYVNYDGYFYMDLLHPLQPIQAGGTYELYAKATGKQPSERQAIVAEPASGQTELQVDEHRIYEKSYLVSGRAAIGTEIVLQLGTGTTSTTVTDGTFKLSTSPSYEGLPANSGVTLYAAEPGRERAVHMFVVETGQDRTPAPSVLHAVYAGDRTMDLLKNGDIALYTLRLNGGAEYTVFPSADFGSFVRIGLPGDFLLQEGDELTIAATLIGMLPSEQVKTRVQAVSGQTAAPASVRELFDSSLDFVGRAEPGAWVTLSNASGMILTQGGAQEKDGYFYFGFYPSIHLKAGETYKVVAQLPGRQASEPLLLQPKAAADAVTSLELTSKSINAAGFWLQGKTEPGAIVMFRTGNGSYSTTADSAGDFAMSSMTARLNPAAAMELIAVAPGMQRSQAIPLAFDPVS
ncbi:S-layer homology domain-containing protein [Cohnella sp. 56]|uniref:S-layer homology domain-containing protein n=1 Tax=Cohnella sp. 56 TaxID=3113722 RepID=UPI0030E7A11E